MVRYCSLEEEVKGGGHRSDALRSALEREDTKNDAGLYLLLRAADRFHTTSHRFPGSFDRSLPTPNPLQLPQAWLFRICRLKRENGNFECNPPSPTHRGS